MSKKNKLLAVLFIIGCIGIVCIAGVVKIASRSNFGDEDVICEGASIDGVDIGGMRKSEAALAVDKHISKLTERQINVNVNGESVPATFGAVGFKVKDNDYVEKAYEIGDELLEKLDIGVTYIKAVGAYSSAEKTIIYCVVSRLEMTRMKEIIKKVDPSAFISVVDVHEAYGGRTKGSVDKI